MAILTRNELFLRFLYLIFIHGLSGVIRINVNSMNLSDVIPPLAVPIMATARCHLRVATHWLCLQGFRSRSELLELNSIRLST